MRIGVDIGGTFTDVVIEGDDGFRRTWKAPSTPPNFADGLMDGIRIAARDLGIGIRDLLDRTTHFVHGTTVTTNVVLTRTGQRVGLVTTRGFGDTYALARQYRGQEQDPAKVTHPVPLVAASDIVEVTERIDYSGQVVTKLNEQELVEGVQRLAGDGIRAFAICLLWSFINPAHEARAKELILATVPDAYVAASYETCPISGEYERTSTSVITAYAGPALKRYATGLDARLRNEGLRTPVLLMKSDGGPAGIDSAVEAAAQTVYSGPAAGVVASKALGEQLGLSNLITFDMGGTSTDVALVFESEIQTTSAQQLDRQPLATPMIDVTSVGAGGGSLGLLAVDRSLRVGPESAGAVPGPACYGMGGTDATITDANVVLGLIDPDYFLGGTVRLDASRSHAALARLGEVTGLTPDEAAYGMFRVVNSVMADAIRLRTVFAGLDPRDFALVSFGGAGGLHCAAVAADLGINTVVIPNNASTFSAVGLVNSDLVYSFARSKVLNIEPGGAVNDATLHEVNGIFAELDERAVDELDRHDVAPDRRTLQHVIEMCYLGQILNFQVEVPARELTAEDVKDLVRSFDERYVAVYGPGAASPEFGYMLKSYKTVGIGSIGDRTVLRPPPPDTVRDRPAPKGRRSALAGVQAGERRAVEVYEGRGLPVGSGFAGPALLEFPDTTVLVPAGFTAHVDDWHNLVLEREGAAEHEVTR